MEWHYDVTMDPIIIMTSHGLYYSIAMMTHVLQLDVFLH